MNTYYILAANPRGYMEYVIIARDERDARYRLRKRLGLNRLPNGTQVYEYTQYHKKFNSNR